MRSRAGYLLAGADIRAWRFWQSHAGVAARRTCDGFKVTIAEMCFWMPARECMASGTTAMLYPSSARADSQAFFCGGGGLLARMAWNAFLADSFCPARSSDWAARTRALVNCRPAR